MADAEPKREGTEVVLLAGENLPDAAILQPKQLDFLETVLAQLYRHQYRHVETISVRRLICWLSITLSLEIFRLAYIESISLEFIFSGLLQFVIFAALISGLLSILSRCLTRLFQYRVCVVRCCQFFTSLMVLDWAVAMSAPLATYAGGFDTIMVVCAYVFIFLLIYRTLLPLIPFKSLRIARGVYVFVGFFLAITFLFIDKPRHYFFHDNEVWVYSDYTGPANHNLDWIDVLVDQAASDID